MRGDFRMSRNVRFFAPGNFLAHFTILSFPIHLKFFLATMYCSNYRRFCYCINLSLQWFYYFHLCPLNLRKIPTNISFRFVNEERIRASDLMALDCTKLILASGVLEFQITFNKIESRIIWEWKLINDLCVRNGDTKCLHKVFAAVRTHVKKRFLFWSRLVLLQHVIS